MSKPDTATSDRSRNNTRIGRQVHQSLAAGLLLLLSTLFCMREQPVIQPPEITISGMDKSDTLSCDSLTVTLEGISDDVEYRYRLDSIVWSEYIDDPDLRIAYLDDGMHILEITYRYKRHDYTTVYTREFYVNGLKPAAVYLFPQKSVLTDSSDTATIQVMIKNLSACDRLHLAVSGAVIDSVYFPEEEANDSLLIFSSDSISDTVTTIDLLVRPGYTPFSGEVATVLALRVIADSERDTTFLSLESTARDTDNVDFDSMQVRGAVILKN